MNPPIFDAHCDTIIKVVDQEAEGLFKTTASCAWWLTRGARWGVNFASLLLTREALEAQWPIYERYLPRLKRVRRLGQQMDRELASTPRPPLCAVADHVAQDHVAHIARVAGVEAAALGSDLDGFAHGPQGLEDCTALNQVRDDLRARGLRGEDLERVCWGNWERVFVRRDLRLNSTCAPTRGAGSCTGRGSPGRSGRRRCCRHSTCRPARA